MSKPGTREHYPGARLGRLTLSNILWPPARGWLISWLWMVARKGNVPDLAPLYVKRQLRSLF